jgi:hypothetical protein
MNQSEGIAMNIKTYIVYFIDGSTLEQSALTAEQAKILAQAKRIQDAREFDIFDVLRLGDV